MTPSCSGFVCGGSTEHAMSDWSVIVKTILSFVSLVPAILTDIPSWSLCLFSALFLILHLIPHCLPRIINITTITITTMTHTPSDETSYLRMHPPFWGTPSVCDPAVRTPNTPVVLGQGVAFSSPFHGGGLSNDSPNGHAPPDHKQQEESLSTPFSYLLTILFLLPSPGWL